jgi:ATP-dependent protease ClpP protease subunit
MKLFLCLGLMLVSTLGFSKSIVLTEKNSISFNNQFTGGFVAQKQLEASSKCYASEGSDIYVVLYTPGGSVSAGQLFFDTLNALPCNFHTITIFAASMGYQTVQNLGKRYILPSGILMSHRASIRGLSGEIGGELNQLLKLLQDNIRELNTIASDRIGISLEKYESLIADELWLTGSQAVKDNHADEIVSVRCDKNFSGSYIQKFRSFFGILDVEFAKCPLITSPLSVRSANSQEVDYVLEYYNNISNHIKMEM